MSRFKFTLIHETLGSLVLDKSPRGWEEIESDLLRSDKFGAVNRELPSSTLLFQGDAEKFIEQAFQIDFVDAVVDLKIEYYINDIDLKYLRTYTLHFADFKRTKEGVECMFNSGEIENIIDSNIDTKYEVQFIDENNDKDKFLYKPVNTVYYSRLYLSANENEAFPPSAGGLSVILPELLNRNKDSRSGNQDQKKYYDQYISGGTETLFITNPEFQDVKDEAKKGFNIATKPGTMTGKIKTAVQIKIRTEKLVHNNTTDFKNDVEANLGIDFSNLEDMVRLRLYNPSNVSLSTFQAINTIIYYQIDSSTGYYRDMFINFFYDANVPLLNINTLDTSIIFFRTQFSNVHVYGYGERLWVEEVTVFKDETDIDIKYTQTRSDEQIRCVRARNALTSIIEQMTGSDIFISKWFGKDDNTDNVVLSDKGSNDILTSELALKEGEVPAGQTAIADSVTLTLDDIFTAFRQIYNLGLSIEKNNQKTQIRIETLEYFYQLEYGGHIGNVTEFQEELSEDMIFNEVGFEIQNTSEDLPNKRFALNIPATYRTPINSVINKLEILNPYETDVIRANDINRAGLKDENNGDYKDGDIFIFKTAGGLDKPVLQDAYIDNFTFLPDETFTANSQFSPFFSLKRYWGWYLNSCLQFKKSGDLKLTENDYNKNTQIERTYPVPVTYDSGANVPVSDLLTQQAIGSTGNISMMPRFEPFLQTFQTEVTFELSKMIENNRHKIFSYDTDSGKKYGFVKKAPTIPGRIGKFKFIKASKYAISQII